MCERDSMIKYSRNLWCSRLLIVDWIEWYDFVNIFIMLQSMGKTFVCGWISFTTTFHRWNISRNCGLKNCAHLHIQTPFLLRSRSHLVFSQLIYFAGYCRIVSNNLECSRSFHPDRQTYWMESWWICLVWIPSISNMFQPANDETFFIHNFNFQFPSVSLRFRRIFALIDRLKF